MSKQSPPPGAHVTYSRQFRRCAKPGCPSCGAGGPGHGPYWYAYWREGGHQRSHYLGKQPPPEADAHPATAAAPQGMPALRVRTLGGLAAWRGEADLAAGTWRPRTAALFACLLSAPGHRMRRDDLAERLWPEGEPGLGRRNLRVTIHDLRRLLDPDGADQGYLRQDGVYLCLAPTPDGQPMEDWPDAAAFARAAARALAGQDRAACRAALALYVGEYLPEYPAEEWAAERREALHAQHQALLLHLAILAERAGASDEAVRCLQRVLGVDSCHEPAARALIRAQLAAGRHEEAVRTYRQLAGAMRHELDLAPDQETEAQYRLALEGRARASAARTNLPAPSTSFIGRKAELAALEGMLGAPVDGEGAAGTRLVAVIGPGGSGKSRLAVELGRALLPRYADGVWLVELAALPPGGEADPGPIARQACAVLGLREEAGRDALAALVTYLAPRRALLLLDNCEHLIQGCAALATALLGRCPELRILATSREGLGLLGEQVWRLASLEAPEEGRQAALPLRELLEYAAVRLFVERGRAARADFVLTEGNRGAVAAVCARLDGLPLAIELAATQLGVLGVGELAARLDDRFRLLTAGNRGALPRHQTLRAVLDWSYGLLGEAERRLLRALAVFAGRWSLAAAEVVCVGGEAEMLEGLTGLVGKSLVQVDRTDEAEGAGRYRLLETVRQYAAHHLQAAGEEGAARDRHLQWYLALAEAADQGLGGPDQAVWLARLEQEHDNLRAALAHARTTPSASHGLRLAAALWRFWEARGHWSEGLAWLEGALDHAGGTPSLSRGRALRAAGILAFNQGDHDRAERFHAESLAMHRGLGDRIGEARALTSLSHIALGRGDFVAFRQLAEEGLAIAHELGSSVGAASNLNNLGLAAYWQGEYRRAEPLLRECLTLRRELAEPQAMAMALDNLGLVHCALGHPAQAVALHEEAHALLRGIGDRMGISRSLVNLGEAIAARGDSRRARELMEEGLAIQRELGARELMAMSLNSLAELAIVEEAHERAASLLEESLALHRAAGDRRGVAIVLGNLGAVALARGDHRGAMALASEALVLYRAMDHAPGIAAALQQVGEACAALGEDARAAHLLAASAAQRRAVGLSRAPAAQAAFDRHVQALRTRLGEAAFRAAAAAGEAMTPDAAIALTRG